MGFFLCSCSFLEKKAQKDAEESSKEEMLESESIPRSEYEALQEKYSELQMKYEVMQEQKEPIKIATESSAKKIEKKTDAVTVDVFGEEGLVEKYLEKNNQAKTNLWAEDKQGLENAQIYLEQKRFDKAMSEIKRLENSPWQQIRVRAKFLSAESFFEQKEYDLALQAYESILENYGFSGYVVKALEKMVTCSQELNLKEKKERYWSLYKDVLKNS
ncbi:MAG: tetratricopeptide repeat protein [Bacteriovoracaceae bacterium]|nr:tetratricopeptide repeat protein [Bacteriovoracaceae bacterium]